MLQTHLYFPTAALVYGSLHFITFDGTEYSFKALGEFVIARLSSNTGSNIFTLQGQTARLHTHKNGSINFPVVVRMAAFYQGIGKVSVLVCIEQMIPKMSVWVYS